MLRTHPVSGTWHIAHVNVAVWPFTTSIPHQAGLLPRPAKEIAVTGRLAEISRDLQSRLRKFFDTTLEANATPLEICQAVLDDVERHVQPVGRGRRVFPYTRLLIQVLQPGADPVPLESAFEGFETRVRERLAELRCEAPRSLDLAVACETAAPSGWSAGQLFAVAYLKEAAAPVLPAPRPVVLTQPALRVTVLSGATSEPAYTFNDPTVSIGRSSDPTDEHGRVRRNRVAFLDIVDGVTETVGRAHARLRFDDATGGYRIYDEGSSNGTAIIRDGSAIAVPPRDPRGVRVRSGDELRVGRAALRVDIGTQDARENTEHDALQGDAG
jgi:FHA domain-containing protein